MGSEAEDNAMTPKAATQRAAAICLLICHLLEMNRAGHGSACEPVRKRLRAAFANCPEGINRERSRRCPAIEPPRLIPQRSPPPLRPRSLARSHVLPVRPRAD